MKRWSLLDIDARGARDPRVLETGEHSRVVVVDLQPGQRLDEHAVREPSLILVVRGETEIAANGEAARCPAGTLLSLAPHERHAVTTAAGARLLLVLSPWPAPDHRLTRASAPDALVEEPLGDLPAEADGRAARG
ncbi:MAG: hypothetical protein R3C15_19770 [Thermoleophilia bacterium]